MRIGNLEYACVPCSTKEGLISLRLEAWHIKFFPLTYTVQECLEDWCHIVGWRYVSHRGGMSPSQWEREYYNAVVSLPDWDGMTQTIVRYIRGRGVVTCERE